ncbi:MAG: phosphotransferase [Planctomycetes bacterium]|nr:phosphotransferase [Planctomycetota bacterium]
MCKLFERGSLADAEREAASGQAAAGPGVVDYIGVETDAETNLPCIRIAWHEGTDLGQIVLAEGAIPAARAAALLAPVAHTLARLHAEQVTAAPHGLCHGDIKPQNLLATDDTTLLLDFEHARPIASGHAGASATPTGTHGFAAPEATQGCAAAAALDVFGLGATLRWLLDGGADEARLPQDGELEQFLAACTAADPARRPTATAAAATLDKLAHRLGDDHEEQLLARIAGGERLEFVSDLPRYSQMRRLAQRQRRVLAHVPDLLTIPDAVPETPAGQLLALHRVRRALRWFPRHQPLLRWRIAVATAARESLAATAETVAAHQRGEQFELAARWLDDAIGLADSLRRLPANGPIPGAHDRRTVGLLQRDPRAFLERLLQQIDDARIELDAATAAIDAAEERFDLRAAEAAIDAMAQQYGGSSPTAARRRDQLHRLAFYLDRMACASPNVERMAQLWDKSALEPLLQLVAACTRTSFRPTTEDLQTAPLGLRSLQVALINLAEEFPHLYVRSGPALDALSNALMHASDLAWELVAKAGKQLAAVPVPVRPLQVTLGRLDTFRILEALVDRPERPRSRLLDAIESMRLKFEQARATRDRLAQGAEQAMARGHWTTGLFDMERAVAGLSPGDEAEVVEAERLQARLEEAKRQKEAIDVAVRRNVELGTRYGLLQDDAASSFSQRHQVLAERRDYLHFLALNLPAERAALYTRDLREVELQMTLEQAGVAETEFDATEEPGERLRLARQTLDRLETAAKASEYGDAPPGRLLRVLEHWRTVAEQCQRDEERRQAERARKERNRRRVLIAALATALTVVVAGWAASPWLLGSPAIAATRASTLTELSNRARMLPAASQAATEELLATVREAVAAAPGFEATSWHDRFAEALIAVAQLARGDDAAALRSFAEDSWRTALSHVEATAAAGDLAELRAATQRLAARTAPFGIAAPTAIAPAKD